VSVESDDCSANPTNTKAVGNAAKMIIRVGGLDAIWETGQRVEGAM